MASGGGISFWPSITLPNSDVLLISQSTISDNVATGGTCWGLGRCSAYGGGIEIMGSDLDTATLTIEGSTISGNTAQSGINQDAAQEAFGGGLVVWRAVTIRNCTVSGNTASAGPELSPTGAARGGGLGVDDGAATLQSCTIANNSVVGGGGGGGGVWVGQALVGTTSSLSTILADNFGISGALNDCDEENDGNLQSQGYNLARAPGNCNFAAIGDQTGVGPQLVPLANNGGPDAPTTPTQTHALLSDSPAVDKGSCVGSGLTIDQRGYSRPFDVPGVTDADDGCDIGAYEFGASAPVLKTIPALGAQGLAGLAALMALAAVLLLRRGSVAGG